MRFALTAVTTFMLAEPAMAAVAIPAPSDVGLFLLGVAGLIIGRRSAIARRAQPKDDSAA